VHVTASRGVLSGLVFLPTLPENSQKYHRIAKNSHSTFPIIMCTIFAENGQISDFQVAKKRKFNIIRQEDDMKALATLNNAMLSTRIDDLPPHITFAEYQRMR